MSFKVECNLKLDISKQLIDRPARLYAHQTAYKLMFDFVPFDTGMLAESVDISESGIHFTQPYARLIYEGDGFNFRRDKHPLATSRWDQEMIAVRGEKLCKSIENYIKARCK